MTKKKEIDLTITITCDGKHGAIKTSEMLTEEELDMLKAIGMRHYKGEPSPDAITPDDTYNPIEDILKYKESECDDGCKPEDDDSCEEGVDYHSLCNMYRAIIKKYMTTENINHVAMKMTIATMVSIFDNFLAEELNLKD